MTKGQGGKPPKIEKNIVKQILIKYRKDIIKPDLKIVSKKDPMWIVIANKLNNLISPSTQL